VDDQLERLDLLQKQMRELDREIRERGQASTVAQALEEIPGIGPFIALLRVAEIGDLSRFPTAQHLVSYLGLAPSLYASGERRWSGQITPNKDQACCVGRWCRRRTSRGAARDSRDITNA